MYLWKTFLWTYVCAFHGGAWGIIVTVVGNGHDDLSSNPCWGDLRFTQR